MAEYRAQAVTYNDEEWARTREGRWHLFPDHPWTRLRNAEFSACGRVMAQSDVCDRFARDGADPTGSCKRCYRYWSGGPLRETRAPMRPRGSAVRAEASA